MGNWANDNYSMLVIERWFPVFFSSFIFVVHFGVSIFRLVPDGSFNVPSFIHWIFTWKFTPLQKVNKKRKKKKRLSNIIRSPAYNNGSFTSVYSRNRCCFKLKWFNDVEFLESSTGSFFTLANKIFKKI